MKKTIHETEYCAYKILVFILWIMATPAQANSNQGKLAIIIDDIGYNLSTGRKIAELPIDITLAVLPFTPHGKTLAELGHQQGKEIMLHTPMSNEQHLPLGPGALNRDVTHASMVNILDKNLSDIPYVKGVNNHMGSQLTQNPEIMGWLMAYLKTRQLYFIDSRTTAKTEALNQAQAYQLPSRKRDVFLDNKRNIQHIRQQLLRAAELAQRQDGAIAIGHPYPETLKALKEFIENKTAIELVLVSELLSTSETKSPELPFCPLDIQYKAPMNAPFVIEDYLSLPNASHKKGGFVIKKI